MRSWGKVDYKALKKFKEKLEKLDSMDVQVFIEKAAKELAARLLAKVIKRTPVGQYEDGTVGGTLRRGWTAKTEQDAMYGAVFGANETTAYKYLKDIPIKKNGTVYEIEIINPVSYGIYVEFGHRTANHKGWVDGQFMLTISERELEAQMPAILEKKLAKYLEEVLLI